MKNEFNPDHIIINVSGGKDSTALMIYALKNFPKEKLVCVHAKIDIDWKETIGVVEAQCAHFDLPLVVVTSQHKDGSEKGFLSKLVSDRIDRKTKAVKQQKFPDMKNRWCTGELKMSPIHKYVRTLRGNILSLLGERREESSQRSKLTDWRPNEKLSKAGRNVVDFSPILDLKESEVWAQIKESKAPVHP